MTKAPFSILFLLLLLTQAFSADAQSFFRRRGLFNRSYQSHAITTPVVQKTKDTHGAAEMWANQVDVSSADFRAANAADVRAHRREQRRLERRQARMNRQYTLAKGVQERSFLGDAVVEHNYVQSRQGR